MQVEIINSTELQKEFAMTIPFQDVNEVAEKKILEAQKDYQLPGFRKGSVPVSLIRHKVGKVELEKALHKKVAEAMSDLIKDNELTPSSRPSVELMNFEEGKEWKFKFVFQLLPKTPTVKWAEITIEKIEVTVTDGDIYKAKNTMLKQFREFEKAKDDYKVQDGDKVKVDFIGKLSGNDFEGSKGENVEIIIGEGNFLRDFEVGCIGMKVGYPKDVDITFPADYPNQDLSDKTAKFSIKINQVHELKKLKEVTEEILEKIGIESVKKLDEQVKNKISYDFIPMVRNHMKKQLFDILYEKYDFTLPQNMIDQDKQSIFAKYEKNKERYVDLLGKSKAEIQEEFEQLAKRRVKLGLIMADFTRKNDIKVEDGELQKIIQDQAERNPQLKDKILDFYKDPENLENIKGPILEEKALDHILTIVKVKDIKMNSEKFIEIAMKT